MTRTGCLRDGGVCAHVISAHTVWRMRRRTRGDLGAAMALSTIGTLLCVTGLALMGGAFS